MQRTAESGKAPIMITEVRTLISALLLVTFCFWIIACGGSNSSTPPVIVTHPASQTVTEGQTATFSVTATGTAPLHYQWQRNGTAISGANAASYTTAATTTADNGATFRAVVGNSAGGVMSNPATLSVQPAVTAPTITTQPANQTVTAGQTTTFSVTATGTAPLTYQWQENGSPISGATSAQYTTGPTTTAANGANFQVVVSNSAGSVTSNSATLTVNPVVSGLSVLTYHNDNSRTGANTAETILTPANVKSATFGKRFAQPVDGQLYAQPLYVPNLAIPGEGTHNVVFVATEANSVYAFDADDNTGANANPLWKVSLIDSAHGAAAGATPLSNNDTGCPDLQPQIGVTSTPVIDPASGTMYVEARSKENGVFVHRLHMLDITSGAEKSPGPATISASVPGTGDGGTTVTFDPLKQHQRAALLLVNGTVYVGFASLCDIGPYHGWLLAYDASTLAQTGVFLATPNGSEGGIWQSGAGPAADSNGNIFTATGNGTFDSTDFGQSILKFSWVNSKFSLVDYFTPFDAIALNGPDLDVGSSGTLLLPDQPGSHSHELVLAGKKGSIYLLDRDQLTTNSIHFCATSCNNTDPEIVQEVASADGGMWSMPAYWNNTIYLWGIFDVGKAFSLNNGLLSTSPTSTTSLSVTIPSPTPSVSSNGSTNGIVWAIDTSQNGDHNPGPGPSVLHAYDATNLANELYNTSQMGSRDQAGNTVKFTVPTVVNGKVYVGTSTELDVYGLLQ